MSSIPSLSSSVSELSGVSSLSLSGSKKLGIPSPSKSPSKIVVKEGVPAAPSPSVPPAKSNSSFASTFEASKSTKLTPAEYNLYWLKLHVTGSSNGAPLKSIAPITLASYGSASSQSMTPSLSSSLSK